MAKNLIIAGVPLCPGIGTGFARIVEPDLQVHRREILLEEVSAEQDRFLAAVSKVGDQLQVQIDAYDDKTVSETAEILRVHHAMLSDEEFHNRVLRRIAAELVNCESALRDEGEDVAAQFESAANPYFQSRAEDIRDLVYRILQTMSNVKDLHEEDTPVESKGCIVICKHLRPSAAIWAHRVSAAGFATESLAVTSHAAMLLKGYALPAVGGVPEIADQVNAGDQIIVDGIEGKIIIEPSREVLDKYEALSTKLLAQKAPAISAELQECRTHDGTQIHLYGNIANPEQVGLVLDRGLEGIGLFRTEFLLLCEALFPSEETQVSVYRDVVIACNGRLLVIRTFDIGGDKRFTEPSDSVSLNPSLGRRGIRRHLTDHGDELRTQLRAILRAANDGNVNVLFPMVTTVKDVKQAKEHLNSVRQELVEEGACVPDNVRVGAMIEVPVAAIGVQRILAEVDFVSLGTNDLLQYFTAADKDNEEVLHYNNVESEEFLWLLKFVIDQAIAVGRQDDVTICGEIAAKPELVSRLVALGYRSFSIPAVMASQIRDAVEETNLA
ncbi:phosphoenolpyruvate--protein phosphotransferase [Candidatus Hydrogenedentota bacterium]